MPQLKRYTFYAYHIYDKRTESILKESRRQLRVAFYVAAHSKDDAVKFVKEAFGNNPRTSELKLAMGNDFEGLLEASLLNEPGVVLVTPDRGGKRPVVAMDPTEGAQAIGVLRPADGRPGEVFESVMAKYAGRGSIAAGAEVAYVKTDLGYPEGVRWVGTGNDELTDREMDLKIDTGELEIIRSGFGNWWRAGR